MLIDCFELPTIYGEEHADLQTMTLQGHDLAITFRTYNGAGFDFRYFAGRVHWDGKVMELQNVRQTGQGTHTVRNTNRRDQPARWMRAGWSAPGTGDRVRPRRSPGGAP